MSLQTFFDNFATVTGAPNSTAKLRELILQLAVQGKLLLQNPADDPAISLLEKVEAERANLVKEKKIKKVREIEDPLPHSIKTNLPCRWQVEWLGNLASAITKGATPTTYGHAFQSEGIRFVKVENVKNNRIVIENIKDFISEEAHASQSRSQLESGDVLFSIAGTIGETCIVKEGDLPANTNQALAIIRGTQTAFLPDFLKLQLDSYVANAVRDKARGGAMNNVSLGDLKTLPVYIPPYQEQARIVAKVDELMRFCDELEARQQAGRASRARLNGATLAPLNNAASFGPEEFEQAAARLADNFAELYDSTETVGKLRSTILQLAVQGRLVPQDPRDKPASALLKVIESDKAKLIKEKKIGKEPSAPIGDDEPFSVRFGWEWVRLSQLTNAIHYGYTASADHNLKAVRLLRITDIQNNKVDWESVPGCEIDEKKLRGVKLGNNDILIARTGGTIGKSYIVENLSLTAVFASYLIRAVPNKHLHANYLKLFLESELYWAQLYAKSMGTGQPNVNATSLKSLIVPLPPLEEQKRIVVKVNQLMALCDDLETKLRQAEADSEKLMNAAVQHVLAAVTSPDKAQTTSTH